MKIKRVLTNNRKRGFVIETAKGQAEYPYSAAGLKRGDAVLEVETDSELGHEGFSFECRSGKTGTVHIDHVLSFNNDSDYNREQLLYQLTIQAQRALKNSKIAKRELARLLQTSPAQTYRLLDQTFYGKSIDQMVRLLGILGRKVTVRVERAA